MPADRINNSSITAEQIRLLTLRRDAATSKPTFRLETFNKADLLHRYVAISYAWEDDTPVSELQLDDGRRLPLSRTLVSLVESLQRWFSHVSVWIDAICINQADAVEKAAQVRSIGSVYANAEKVIIWLGSANKDAALAYRYILSKAHLSWPQDWEVETNRGHLDDILPILDKPWFRRLWIIQEAVLGNDVLMMCDTFEPTTFAHFTNCVNAIWRYCQSTSAADYAGLAQRSLRCISRLLTIRDEYRRSGGVSYELLLQASRFCEMTDPRDRIFGLRGIAMPCEAVPLPDYSIPVSEVPKSQTLRRLYIQTSRALLCQGKSLDSLALAGLADRQPNTALPSWVMNLQDVFDGEPLTTADNGHWSAAREVESRAREHSPEALLVNLGVTDEIMICCKPFDLEDVRELRTCLDGVMNLWRFKPQSAVQGRDQHELSRSWKNEVIESLLMGLDIDDVPVTGDQFLAEFDQWIRLVSSKATRRNPAALHDSLFHRTAYIRIDMWRACLTKGGDLCLAPAAVREGDCVCIVPGCRFPLVLRELERGESVSIEGGGGLGRARRRFELVSWCYVNGWMRGERCNDIEDAEEVALY